MELDVILSVGQVETDPTNAVSSSLRIIRLLGKRLQEKCERRAPCTEEVERDIFISVYTCPHKNPDQKIGLQKKKEDHYIIVHSGKPQKHNDPTRLKRQKKK